MSVSFEHPNIGLTRRQETLEMLQAGLVGADPYRAVRRAVEVSGDRMTVGEEVYDLSALNNIYLVGAGKAAAPMARAMEDLLEGRLGDGVIAVKDGYTAGTSSVAVGEAGHPFPDRRSIKAARAVTHIADVALEGDLVICLMSGGGSSTVELPAGQLELEDIRQTTAALLASGLSIGEINAVRKHLSSIKGGKLAELIAPARHLTIAVSDVVGDRLDAIASGPTAPDPTSYGDALDILDGADLVGRVPAAVVEHLEAGREGEHEETPGEDHPTFQNAQSTIVSSRIDAVEAARKGAAGSGYNPHVVTTEMEGEAREVGRRVVDKVRRVCREGEPVPAPACLLWAGETTVTIQGQGKGGRNQEMALSAAIALEEVAEELDRSVLISAFATDGTDGPTRSAGAIVDTETAERGRRAGLDPREALADNNSFAFLDAAGELIFTGPTCNNVNDIVCVLIG